MQEQGLGSGHDDGAERRSEDVAVSGAHGLAAPADEHESVAQTPSMGETQEATPHVGAAGDAGPANFGASADESSRRESEAGNSVETGVASTDVHEAEDAAAALFPTEFASPPSEDASVHPASQDWQISQEQPEAPTDSPTSPFDAAALAAAEPPAVSHPSHGSTPDEQPTGDLPGDPAETQEVRLYRSGTDATPHDMDIRQEAVDATEGHRLSQPSHYEAQQVVVPPQQDSPAEVVEQAVPVAEQEPVTTLVGAASELDHVDSAVVQQEESAAPTGHEQAIAPQVGQDDPMHGLVDSAASEAAIATQAGNAKQDAPAVPAAPRREAAPAARSLADLSDGQVITGRVKSLAAFGAFVDLGLRERKDGLIHVSQLADRRIGHPSEVVQVGQEVTVRVVSVDRERGRIGLSLRDAEEQQNVPSSYRSAPVEAPPVQDEVTMQALLARYARPSADSQLPPQRGSRRADRDRQEREDLLRRLREESTQS